MVEMKFREQAGDFYWFVLFQVQISENAMFLINLNIVYRLIDLIKHQDPIIREKVCLTLTHLAGYHQGRKRIMSRGSIIENLMWIIMRDRKEIRYAAAYTLRTLSRDRCSCETIMNNETIIENLLKMVKDEHIGILVLHLKTLKNLLEWNPVRGLKANGFQTMLGLFTEFRDKQIVSESMNVMTQLCKHDVGMRLADNNDLTHILRRFLRNPHADVLISTVGLMEYTTITTRSKWRAKEFGHDLTDRLVALCHSHNKPLLQIRCMQVLINLCDCPDIRYYIKVHLEKKVWDIKIRTHEQWDGTTETMSYGLETGHNYRTMCIEGVETIKNDYGDNAEVLNVHSFLRRVHDTKDRLVKAIDFKPYRDMVICR